MPPPLSPEQQARERIDAMLVAAGRTLQDVRMVNVGAGLGIAVREYHTDADPADYILFVDRKPVGVVEAKKPEEDEKFTMHEEQVEDHATAKLPWTIGQQKLPFCYLSTGEITKLWDTSDPEPPAREVFSFHRSETLQEWLKEAPLRERLTHFPALDPTGLRDRRITAITNLEKRFSENRPCALVHMATGSGKTCTANAGRWIRTVVRIYLAWGRVLYRKIEKDNFFVSVTYPPLPIDVTVLAQG